MGCETNGLDSKILFEVSFVTIWEPVKCKGLTQGFVRLLWLITMNLIAGVCSSAFVMVTLGCIFIASVEFSSLQNTTSYFYRPICRRLKNYLIFTICCRNSSICSFKLLTLSKLSWEMTSVSVLQAALLSSPGLSSLACVRSACSSMLGLFSTMAHIPHCWGIYTFKGPSSLRSDTQFIFLSHPGLVWLFFVQVCSLLLSLPPSSCSFTCHCSVRVLSSQCLLL